MEQNRQNRLKKNRKLQKVMFHMNHRERLGSQGRKRLEQQTVLQGVAGETEGKLMDHEDWTWRVRN